jgi:hypothetical protein
MMIQQKYVIKNKGVYKYGNMNISMIIYNLHSDFFHVSKIIYFLIIISLFIIPSMR